MNLSELATVPLTELDGVTATLAESLRHVGITNVYDLLHTIPRRYIDLSQPQLVKDCADGEVSTVVGTIRKLHCPQGAKVAKLSVHDSEGGVLNVLYFNPRWNIRKLSVGDTILVHAKLEKTTMTNPLIEHLEKEDSRGIIGVYPASGKHSITTWQVHNAMQAAIALAATIVDPVPAEHTPDLPTRAEAYRMVHAPRTLSEVRQGRDRLAYDELLRLQLVIAATRQEQDAESAIAHTPDGTLWNAVVDSLPFPLTSAQQRCINDIDADLRAPRATHRLLQGDVGSGKAQPLTSLVLTPTGFVAMGTLKVGDLVMAADGAPAEIRSIHPQGKRLVYDIHFSDGSVARADGEHLWKTSSGAIVTTLDMAEDLYGPDGDALWHLPPPRVSDLGPHVEDAYTIGRCAATYHKSVVKELSAESRLALLQGIMDKVGTTHNGRPQLETSEKLFADDVVWLARSLGGVASVRLRNGQWVVNLLLPTNDIFRDPRKLSGITTEVDEYTFGKVVTKVVRSGREEVQCILIDHPSHLYITDGFTVTHNTMVSLAALLKAVESGHQGALVAPTEILAQQHYEEITARLRNVPINIALLTGRSTGKKAVLAGLADGTIHIVVGTHALLQPNVTFRSLGAAVVDEQHRFGVEQRNQLKTKGPNGRLPDVLYASATPIPRSAAMTTFGDLDMSVLDEMPAGRVPVETTHCPPKSRDMWDRITQEIDAGHQVFVVCPLVTSLTKEATAAEEIANKVRDAKPHWTIGVAHGKQSPDDRRAAMAAFERGETNLLVATTVIEVGVNVPNATVMVVLEADKFGIAQLHQLRGRVGRGAARGYCYLVATPTTDTGKERLAALVASTDGFVLAEMDLHIRGAGKLLSGEQSGTPRDLKVANVLTDTDLLQRAKKDATTLVDDPRLREEITTILGKEASSWLTSS